MIEKINNLINLNKNLSRAKILDLCNRKLYQEMPLNDDDFIEVCNQLIETKKWEPYWLVTVWVKKRETTLNLKYLSYFEKWLYEYTNSWGACDVFCYRILNPMFEKYPHLFSNILNWAHSDQVYVRRAAAVSFIHVQNHSFCINKEFEKVKTICDILIDDRHIHIQKAIGWLLKYAYLKYPTEVVAYLKRNITTLSRTSFRYALEKVEQSIRQELMIL